MEIARGAFVKIFKSSKIIAIFFFVFGCAPVANQSQATTVVATDLNTMVEQSRTHYGGRGCRYFKRMVGGWVQRSILM